MLEQGAGEGGEGDEGAYVLVAGQRVVGVEEPRLIEYKHIERRAQLEKRGQDFGDLSADRLTSDEGIDQMDVEELDFWFRHGNIFYVRHGQIFPRRPFFFP